MHRDELACQELVELVTDFLEGALSPAQRARFEAHVAECDHCALYLEQMRATMRTLGALTDNRIEPAARDVLLAIFRDWERG